MDLSALEFMMKEFPEVKERDEMRKIIGRYGLSGQQQVGLSCQRFTSADHLWVILSWD